jgi:DNA-binding response OmpR family regulator
MTPTMIRKTTILLIDDDPQLIRLVRANLESDRYRVLTALDAEAARQLLDAEKVDLVILDIMLPEVDGYEICRRIREFSGVPIIMLTARSEDEDKVKGLRLGADDYLTKPFNLGELLARVEAVLRRARPTEEGKPRVYCCDDIVVDFNRRRVTVKDTEVSLTLTEYKLLCELVSHAGRVLLHRELLTKVWGAEYQEENDYLRAYIRHLRRKIESDPHRPRYIISKPGIGYLFCPSETA